MNSAANENRMKVAALAMAGILALLGGCDSGLDLPPQNQTPTSIALLATPSSGSVPLTVQFTGGAVDSDGTIVSYQLDFGDGTGVSTNPNAVHTYTVPPSQDSFFHPALIARDNDGAIAVTSTTIDLGCGPVQPIGRFGCEVRPVFGLCTGCHSSSNTLIFPGDYDGDYDAAILRVNTQNPDASSLLRKPLGLDAHGGGVIFQSTSSPGYEKIRSWIAAGALKN